MSPGTVEENWSDTTGTTYYQGSSVYRGDVALVRITSPKISGTHIYRGPRDSSTHSPVLSRLNRYAMYGDQVYVGGQTQGETGPWTVAQVGLNWWYSDAGPNVWVRNVTSAPHNPPGGTCIDQGDSGGSVFTLVTQSD